jgi:SAM-dependent methyltransferase
MPKDRGIEKADRYFGDFTKIIAKRVKKLKKGQKLRILDAGCGFGVAMIGFYKRFGNKVEITGFNYSQYDGNQKRMKKEAIKKGIFTEKEYNKIPKRELPKFVYCDASKKLPFKDNTFDFIYSMASIYLYDDKIHFLKECNRIVKKNGLVRISPSFGIHNDQAYGKVKHIPPEFWEFWKIYDKGKQVKPENYLRKVPGIKIVWKNKGKGDKPFYLEIKKQKNFDPKLHFVSSVDMNFIWTRWGGVVSYYTTQTPKDFIPRYKKK